MEAYKIKDTAPMHNKREKKNQIKITYLIKYILFL